MEFVALRVALAVEHGHTTDTFLQEGFRERLQRLGQNIVQSCLVERRVDLSHVGIDSDREPVPDRRCCRLRLLVLGPHIPILPLFQPIGGVDHGLHLCAENIQFCDLLDEGDDPPPLPLDLFEDSFQIALAQRRVVGVGGRHQEVERAPLQCPPDADLVQGCPLVVLVQVGGAALHVAKRGVLLLDLPPALRCLLDRGLVPAAERTLAVGHLLGGERIFFVVRRSGVGICQRLLDPRHVRQEYQCSLGENKRNQLRGESAKTPGHPRENSLRPRAAPLW